MKATETKSTHTQQHDAADKSSADHEQERAFFSASSLEKTPFFRPTATSGLQAKPMTDTRAFFRPASVPTIQAKCATCTAEDMPQHEEVSSERSMVQRMPAFESGAEPPPEEANEKMLRVQRMPAFSSEGDAGDRDDVNASQSSVQFSLKIGQPGDAYEREADAMADRVVSMPKPMASDLVPKTLNTPHSQGVNRKQTVGMRSLMRQQTDSSPIPAPKNLESRLQAQGSGSPLDASTRTEMEGAFDANFSGVQIHTGQEAATLNQSLGARAFTHGNKIFFNSGEYQPQSSQGKHLLAHELTHTLQQGASVQRSQNTTSNSGEPMIQGSWWDDLIDFAEDVGWRVVREFAPGLEPILRKGPDGIFEWVKDLVGSAIESVFNNLMSPVRAIAGIDSQLTAQFAPILASIQAAASQIAANDCTPIREAAAKIEQAAMRLITPIVEKLQPVVAKIKDFLNGVWDKIGAPIWGWIQQFASAQWEKIQWLGQKLQAVGKWIWDKTATIRSIADRMWTWLKNKLGIGDGAEGQNGLLQWVQKKIDAAWTVIKAKLEPFKQQLTSIGLAVGGVALALSPAGPVLAVGAAVVGAVKGLRWISANWGKGNMIVQARTYVQKTLIPMLMAAANRFSAAVTRMANAVNSALGSLATGMMNAVSAIGGSLLRVAMTVVQWIADKVVALADWARQTLGNLTNWLEQTLNTLQTFLQKMLNFFVEVGKVVLNIWLLPAFLAKTVWNWIPQCIRDPIIDFIGPLILRQIEIFQELAKDQEAWQKTKADVLKIINLVFVNHDLMGAVKATFHLILRVFNVPPELLVSIVQKAINAWDTVSKKPIEFIKNTVRAIGHGFRRLWRKIGEHIKYGLEGWLFGELAEKNISPPLSWSDPKAIFNFVLDVLGITTDNIWKLLAQRFPPEKVAKVRLLFGKVTRAVEWITQAIDTSKSPAENAQGILNQAKDFGVSILTGIAEWVAGKVAEELAILAAAAAASGGLSEVLDVVRRIYKAIKTAVRWARRILDMVNQTFDNIIDIAAGNLEPVGVKLEEIMHRAMPIVIGFLADQVGLGGVGQALRDVVDKLREKVDAAILWLIDKIKAGIEALIGAVKAGIAALMDWWKAREEFTTSDGEPHSLYFVGQDEQARLTIASDKEDYETFIKNISTRGKSEEFKTAHAQALTIAQDISQKQNERTFDDDARKKKAEYIGKKLNALVKPTKILANLMAKNPPSVVTYGSLTSEGGATSMNAQILSQNHPAGSGPSDEASIWQKANRRKGIFIQGHLLNDNLGGPGRMYNMTPITRSANGTHHSDVEKDIKDAVINQGEVVRYKVTVNYGKHPRRSTHTELKSAYIDMKNHIAKLKRPTSKHNEELNKMKEKLEIMDYEAKYLATSLTANWGILKHDGSEWVNQQNKPSVPITSELPNEVPDV